LIGRYWSSGISLRYVGDRRQPSWHGSLDFYDEGFASDSLEAGLLSTEGMLRTRYVVPTSGDHRDALTGITDTLQRDAETLGITWRDPCIFAEGNRDDPAHPYPGNWKDLLHEQADRLGWEFPYSLEDS
jgi:hypothetical protein